MKNRKRRLEIIGLLVEMSRNGWANADRETYLRLEAELESLS